MEFNVEMKYVLDTTWLLLSGILVMWMAAGFAMLEAGLTQAKNTVTILTKNITLYGFACLMYWVIGYNLMYGEGNAVFGLGLGMSGMTNSDHALMADFFFQVVFVATAASIVSGAVAERMKFWAFIVFTVVLTAIIYPLQGHWTWGGSALGGLLDGFTDFAGSTIVHSVGGWAALAGVLLLGARRGKFPEKGGIRPIPGSNMPLATLGTFILWLGWFGFNGGSQLALGSKADVDAVATVIVNTNMAACAGALSALILTQLIYKKIDLSMVLNGALSGLVSITAGPDYPSVAVTLLIGAVAGMIVVFAVPMFDRLRIDDPVGALSVHLVNGIWGTLAVGIFNPEVSFLTQLLGVVVIGGFTFVSSLAVWFVIRKAMGLRVSEQEEIEGIDLHEFGMEAYPEFRPGFLPG
ncbi:MAG: ammonium transporter [SAR324 cluster bacterium]|nr:ammonium transporter [SAR324 cluster bacterium]MCZ6644877.1 ammonium transporter [SAR324 cluster bacterium]